jgi:dihydropteroate synthase
MQFSFDARPITIMGIVNVTPDSFSDGGRWASVDAAVRHAQQLVLDGANLVDIGGESTRPNASDVAPKEELQRVIPVIEKLTELGIPASIDTRRATVASAALEAGAVVVNDVSGLRDPDMAAIIGAAGAGVVIMHAPSEDMSETHKHAGYDDVVGEVQSFLLRQVQLARSHGISQIAIDPGFGFGKRTEENLLLLQHLRALSIEGCSLLVGASRKRFIGEISGVAQADQRDLATILVHLRALDRGAQIVRVHDVAGHAQAIRVWQRLQQDSANSPTGSVNEP